MCSVTRSRPFSAGVCPKISAPTRALAWLLVMFTAAVAGCSGGSQTSPSGPFTGSWSGTFGAGIPMSLTLAQDGSAVAGIATITLSSGTSSQSVSGTASGSTATVSFASGGSTIVSNATLTLSGSTLSVSWPGSSGTPVTGTLTATSAPVAPASGTFDGTYDFSFVHTNPGAPDSTVVLNRFFIVTSGRISATDGTLSGSVTPIGSGSFSGTATFVGPCPINNGLADFSGTINAGGGPKTGLGNYTCRIGGISRSWRVYNGG